MSDPHRLLDISQNEVERLLLRAGRAAAPPGAQKRALVAATAVLGASVIVGNAAVGSAVGSGGLSAKAASLAALGSIKWLALVGAIGVGTVASAVVIQHATSLSTSPIAVSASPAPTHPALPLRPPPPPPRAPTPAVTATVEAPHALVPPSVPAPAQRAPSFSDELATLDRARGAMDAGEPARALSILEGYRARFPNGTMRPEAAILRIEALEKAGDHAAAVRAADALLESDPSTPYAARVRSVVGAPNP